RSRGGLAFEGEVADLVDDDQGVALGPARLVVEGIAVLGGFEAVDPLLSGRERDAVPGLAGPDRQGDREVGLAGAGRLGVALLMLWMRRRSGCGSWTRRASCTASSWRCWAGARRTTRLP